MKSSFFYRNFEIRAEGSKGAVEVAFSSEAPVKRWFGDEILLHGEDNVDLNRLNTVGSVLYNHNPDKIIASVRKAWLKDRQGKALIEFDSDPDSKNIQAKVASGSLKGASVGYQVQQYRKLEQGEEYEGYVGPCYLGVKWVPYEITLTPVPADGSVGVGRELTRSLDGIEIINFKKEEAKMRYKTNDDPLLNERDCRKGRVFLEFAKLLDPDPALRVRVFEDAIDYFATGDDKVFRTLETAISTFKAKKRGMLSVLPGGERKKLDDLSDSELFDAFTGNIPKYPEGSGSRVIGADAKYPSEITEEDILNALK